MTCIFTVPSMSSADIQFNHGSLYEKNQNLTSEFNFLLYIDFKQLLLINPGGHTK